MMELKKTIARVKTKSFFFIILLSLLIAFVILLILVLGKDAQSSKYIYILKAYIFHIDTSPRANYSGIWISWNFNGTKYLEQEYMNGREHGKTILYDNNGYKLGELTRIRDVMDGVVRQWYPNQQLKSQGFYKEGKLHGQYQYWSDKGELIADGEYIEGSPYEGTFARANPYNIIDRILEYRKGTLIKETKYKH